ncbi:MAG: hypothetical protein JWO79_1199 [Actinomycetia bacterium]|nr:hypothetical protein [Actinomycetes bacterium]MDQ1653050.1 hypothetical protein [Cryptosporangiaceae bacterium]MDQ1656753.1 hypothetical protein [Cryptosporangiaceae bacterium]
MLPESLSADTHLAGPLTGQQQYRRPEYGTEQHRVRAADSTETEPCP